MSETGNSAGLHDVLASIRHLVAEEMTIHARRVKPKLVAGKEVMTNGASNGPLLLTPLHRVAIASEPVASGRRDDGAAVIAILVAMDAPVRANGDPAPQVQPEPVMRTVEATATPSRSDPLVLDFAERLDTHTTGIRAPENAAPAAQTVTTTAPIAEPEFAEIADADRVKVLAEGWTQNNVIEEAEIMPQVPAAFEPEMPKPLTPEVDAAAVDPVIPLGMPEAERVFSPHLRPTNAEAKTAALSADEALDILDEETLREIVRDVLREELQGVFGERITRNVRKLVRTEIARMIQTRGPV